MPTYMSQGKSPRAAVLDRRGDELGQKQPGWRYPSAAWVQQAERRVELDGLLPAFRRGDRQPRNAAECLELAEGEEAAVDAMRPHLRVEMGPGRFSRAEVHYKPPGGRPFRSNAVAAITARFQTYCATPKPRCTKRNSPARGAG